MDDRFIKYVKVYAISFLLFLCIPVSIALIVGFFYGFSTLIFSKPADAVFHFFTLSLPVTVFSTVYYIFFRRTKSHPAKTIRAISYIFFVVAIIIAIIFFILDMNIFFKKSYNTIAYYNSFSLAFLAGNVALLFLIAIMQALTTSKEQDWLKR